jgi:hypothetical protein
MTTTKNEPDAPCQSYIEMAKDWELVDALHDGTRGMRDKGEKYLPKEPKEPADAYRARLGRAVLFPGLKRALKNFVGKAFANSVNFTDMDDQWTEWFANVDLAGTSIQQFSEMVFHSGLKYGHTAVQAEYPVVPGAATAFEERQVIKARPYLVHRCAKAIIGWRTELVENQKKITRVRLAEEYTEYADPWDDTGCQSQIRVLAPGTWELWRKDAKEEWYLESSGTTSITDKIPLVPIYFDQDEGEVFESTVPMGDLAWTNVAHWQSYSDQRNILRIARVPMIFVSGATPSDLGGQLDIGPNRFIALANPNADMKFIEHSGAAIAAGRTDCIDLEDRMNTMAAEAMMSKPGTETATGRSIDARDATSPLAVWVAGFEQAMNQAFELMAEYAGLDKAPQMQMTRDFGILGNTSDLEALKNMRATREISRPAFLDEMKRRGVLNEMYDADADQELIDSEPVLAPPLTGGFGNDPGNEDEPTDKGPTDGPPMMN